MLHKSLYIIKDFIAVFLTAALIVLSFPNFDFGWLAWIGLIPLLIVLSRKGPGVGFIFAQVCGMLIIIGGFRWILEVGRYTAVHHALLVVYLGLYVGLFGSAFSFICRRWGLTPALAAAPFLWISLEFLKSNLSFMALPWLLLSHSQYQYTPVIQVAAVTGAHGISFLIVLVNVALVIVTLKVGQRLRWNLMPISRLPSRHAMLIIISFTATLATAAVMYGHAKISESIPEPDFKVAVVQGNIPQGRKWDRHYAENIMVTYADLSRKAAAKRPDLIVWPETATPGAINRNRRLNARVRNLAKEVSVPLLLGSSQQRKFDHKKTAKLEYKNSAFLIPPARGVFKHQRYDKIQLLPFGEYLPLKGTIPWEAIEIPDLGGYTAGKVFTVFEMPNIRFAVTICWENIFPDLVRQFVKNGAQFVINITNEAWFGKSAAPYQFLSMSVFRAVENGVFIIRCANTGISCFIDHRGNVYKRVNDENGEDIFVRGIQTASIQPRNSKTLYTQYGNWLAWLSVAVSIIFIVTAIAGKRHIG